MLTKTITYTDYNGTTRTEDFLFNLNESELTTMDLTEEGGLANRLKTIVDRNDLPEITKFFREFIHLSYGEKTPDGRRFVKSDEISTAFEQTEAYNMLFLELGSDAKKAATFIQNVLPPRLREAAAKATKDAEAKLATLPSAAFSIADAGDVSESAT